MAIGLACLAAAAACGSDSPAAVAPTTGSVAAEIDATNHSDETTTTRSGDGTERGLVTVGDFERFVAEPDQVELVWRDADGEPFGQLERARRSIEAESGTVRLILNSGLYRPGLIPAGLHIEDGVELTPINLNDGAGNFHLVPNGVFFVEDGRAAVLESNAYAAAEPTPRLAVQSGPMLTIDGAIHPRFRPTSKSRHVRNGVGVTTDGRVVFLQSVRPVTLWEFAEAFLASGAPNSLYLDGTIARMEAPVEGRPIFFNIPFAGMLAVVDPG